MERRKTARLLLYCSIKQQKVKWKGLFFFEAVED